jgi:hypothetical protein
MFGCSRRIVAISAASTPHGMGGAA